MATRRMLGRAVSTSRKLKTVSDKAALLFTWLIAFTDDFGLAESDPGVVRDIVVPHRKGFGYKVVEKCLDEMEDADLIDRYVAENSVYLYIRNFDKFQSFRGDRKRKVEFPLPPPGILPDGMTAVVNGKPETTNDTPKGREAKLREFNLREEEGKEREALSCSISQNLQEVIMVSKLGGLTTKWIEEKLKSGVPEDFLVYAIEEARDAESIRYVEKIVERGRNEDWYMNPSKPKPKDDENFKRYNSDCSLCGREDVTTFKDYSDDPWLCKDCRDKQLAKA